MCLLYAQEGRDYYFTTQLLYNHNLKSMFQRLQVKNLHLITCLYIFFAVLPCLTCAGICSTLPVGHREYCKIGQE